MGRKLAERLRRLPHGGVIPVRLHKPEFNPNPDPYMSLGAYHAHDKANKLIVAIESAIQGHLKEHMKNNGVLIHLHDLQARPMDSSKADEVGYVYDCIVDNNGLFRRLHRLGGAQHVQGLNELRVELWNQMLTTINNHSADNTTAITYEAKSKIPTLSNAVVFRRDDATLAL